VGQVVAGKYRVEAILGEGGMGTVLAAHHVLLDQDVAVKLLSPDLARQEGVVARFLREAKAAARLKSEHVARVMDVGTLESGQPYIVMELLEGEDLDQRLARAGPLATPAAVDCILQALEAMAHAHAVGIVHRDLKPANLFLLTTPDRGEILRVLDFGIAKLAEGPSSGAGERSGGLTGEHALGSPSYMAPEQVRASKAVDGRADIWALGAILYELLTGRTAFEGATVGEIFANVLHERPRPMEERPDAPAELVAFVNRCLERDVDRRFENVAAAARAIAPFGSGRFASYVERIEHTLEHAGKTSDPERTWRRPSFPDDPRVPSPTPSSKRLLVPALASTVPEIPRPRRARFALLAVSLAGIVTIAVAAFTRVKAPASGSSATATTATALPASAAAAAPSVLLTAPSATIAAASSSAAPSATAAAVQPPRRTPWSGAGVPVPGPKPQPKPSPPPSSSPPGLPSALTSPN
jgi:serine/threonine-protein kinase